MHISLTRTASLALVSMVFILTATLPVRAGSITSTGSFSGTAITANLDFDHSNQSTPAFTGTFAGTDSHWGNFTGQNVAELTPVGSCTLPGGVANAGTEFTLVGGSTVIRNQRGDLSGDLHFDRVTSFTQCIDFSTGAYNFSFTDTTTGGTGKFEGATGTTTANGTGAILSLGADGHVFGWDQATYTMTLTIPKH